MKIGSRSGWHELAILARAAFLITSFVIWFLGGL